MAKRIKVLFLAAEAAPFIKVGGLADFTGALPKTLRKLPQRPDIRLVIPLHKQIDKTRLPRKQTAVFQVWHSHGPITAEVFETELDGLPVYLIGGAPFDQATHVYTSDTRADGYKYTFFSLAALELCRQLDWQPDIVHAQDWHTAPAVYALKTNFSQEAFFERTHAVQTIHNLPYLGNGAGPAMNEFGLAAAQESELPWWAQDMPLPLGLLTADRITTVSEGYAQEILTEEFGSGLHDFLRTRQDALSGIINGLDMAAWDPASDSLIESNFHAGSLPPRKANKTALLKELGLEMDPGKPLLAFIGRMDHQKGVEIALDALTQISSEAWQAVLLGSGDPDIEQQVLSLAQRFPERVRVVIGYNERLSRQMYAGADILMMPSRYEPCGTNQMIAMHYGCIPVARATGGLRDTIIDQHAGQMGTGFLFEEASGAAMAAAMRQAIAQYFDRRRWPHLQKRAMKQDFSWKNSAVKYLDVYRSLVTK